MHPTHAPIPGQAAFQSLVPFGLGQDKPHHFREMAEVLWENRGQERSKAVTFYAYPQGTAAQ